MKYSIRTSWRSIFAVLGVALGFAAGVTPALAQTAPTTVGPPIATPPAVSPSADGASLDALINALYATLSGPVGPRDWDRFNALFHKDGVLIPTGPRKDGSYGARFSSPATYAVDNASVFATSGFFEREIGRTVVQYGEVAQVTSAYEARHDPADAEPFLSGVNFIQAFYDGQRWWVLSVAWRHQTPDTPIPAALLQLPAQ